MDYDPIKDRMGAFFSKRPFTQRLFYGLLNLVFLRAWYVRRALRERLGRQPAKRPVRVLDAGTGFGQYAYHLVKTYPQVDVLAVDVKQDYLDNARRFFDRTRYASRVTWAQADLTRYAEPDAFDVILSVDVMEHIEDDRAVFRNFAQSLRSGGHVIVNTPSDQGGSGVKEAGQESFIGEHVRDGYNREELQNKLREAGLEPVDCRYSYGRYGTIAWRVLIRWPMELLGRSWALAVLLPFYYIPALPLGLLLNALDVRAENPTGTGLIVVARKP